MESLIYIHFIVFTKKNNKKRATFIIYKKFSLFLQKFFPSIPPIHSRWYYYVNLITSAFALSTTDWSNEAK